MRLPFVKIPAGVLKFLSEIFQEEGGGASMKRSIFLLFSLAFCAISAGVYFHAVDQNSLNFLDKALGYMKEIIIWMGGFILAEKTPAALSAFKGNLPAPVVSTVVTEDPKGN
jgi:hypothetical protein